MDHILIYQRKNNQVFCPPDINNSIWCSPVLQNIGSAKDTAYYLVAKNKLTINPSNLKAKGTIIKNRKKYVVFELRDGRDIGFKASNTEINTILNTLKDYKYYHIK